jgi:ABC-type Fe3+-hydroxamate transport system substrate-binding protein
MAAKCYAASGETMGIRSVLLGMFLTLLTASAFAHGDKVHVRGTITSVSDTSVTVKSPDGKTVEVKLVKSTTYVLHQATADQAAKVSDLAVGDIVVIHATPEGNTLEAAEVRFSLPVK